MSRRTARAATLFASKAAQDSQKTKPKTHGRVVPDLSLFLQFQRIGGGLSPQQVSAIIREADNGYMYRLMDLASDCRQRDCHLQSVLATSEESIAGLPWELELPEKPKAKEKRAAKIVEDALRNIGLEKLFAHHAGARFIGYAVTETTWARDGALVVPASFNHLAPRRFAYRIMDGKFVWRDQTMPVEGVDLDLYPRKFIQSHPRVTGDVPVREGLVRVLMWAALFRNWTIGDWLKLGETAWKPWRTGQYKKGSSQEDIDNLTAILEGLTSNGVATYSEDVNVEVQWAKGGSAPSGQSVHGELVAMMAAEMSKCVLGQTLSTEQGKVGSQALGNVQNDQKIDLRNATARYVGADATRDLVAPMFAMNWGSSIRPSRLRFITDDAVDTVAMSQVVGNLVKAGLKGISASWVREQAGIPEPEGDEETLEAPKPTAAPPKQPGKAGADPDANDEPDDDAEPVDPTDEPAA